MRLILWFRYRLVFKGLDKLNPEILNKPGGVLFLPSHPAVFVDPLAVTLGAMKKYPVRPLVVEYMYYAPVVHTLLKFIDSVPVPKFSNSSNSLKRRKSEKVMETVMDGLRNGENFLIYPAGKVKLSAHEVLGGSSGVHQILQEVPEVNVVLVRVKGLWGSRFSSYYGGKETMTETIMAGLKCCLKNLLFFTPRREVIVEFEPAPADCPLQGSRMELNRYLEDWYNRPDGLTLQKGELPGDSLVLVSYSMWGEKYPEAPKEVKDEDLDINLSEIPNDIKDRVIKKVAEVAEKEPSSISPEMNLAMDIGLDSLDIAELSAFLQDEYDVKGVPVNQLTTVSRLMALAAKQISSKEEDVVEADISEWKQPIKRIKLDLAPGNTIAETFLNNSARMGNAIACGDLISGVMTYKQLRMRAILLAEYIRHLPGAHIGILLPASAAANLLILAIELSGKIPLMVNWTVGPRHFEAVNKLADVEVILTSWGFIDKLDNIDLDGIEDKLVMLEDVRRKLTLWDKCRAMLRTQRSTKSVLKVFNIHQQKKSDIAVLLFTSGTENLPKGVPLSHENILSNMRGVFHAVDVYSDDVLFGILPPFHAFGFTISSLFGLLAGLKIASFPDPTDAVRLAQGIEKWGVTIVCGTPSFLKGILKSATPEQMASLRICVTGAEKAPADLFKMMRDLGKENALLEGYGITECAPILTVNPFIGEHRGVGKALESVEICCVHHETFENVPFGTQGLILARGPNVFSGYLNKDVASPFMTHEDKVWYKTGDLGFLDREGYLTITGRQKRFIKMGGEMISLASIEDALIKRILEKGPAILEHTGPPLAVIGKEIAGDKTKIFLFVSFPMTTDEANQMLKQEGFSNLARISKIIQLNEIPLMGTGKINYRALDTEYLNKELVENEF
ncbi:MAG: AMP-binding protein [Parachlamydiaceae bacterium]|nr:AMP-binding protein [Parachlamydiaceae bacterium]